jgi:predicted kinase
LVTNRLGGSASGWDDGNLNGCLIEPFFVVVSGPPASGKSTLAPLLARELNLPLLAKDTIKDALVAVLDVREIEFSRRLGTAAVSAMFAIARNCPSGAVLESVFHRSRALGQIRTLPGVVVEVFCSCDRAVAEDRYMRRATTERRGYFDSQRLPEELWNDEIARPVAGGWPVIEIDTTADLDAVGLVAQVKGLHP